MIINSLYFDSNLLAELLHYSAYLVVLVCIPALLYFVLLIIERDALLLDIRSYAKLSILLIFMASVGFTIGKYNYILFSCSDFMYAGSYEPHNCKVESNIDVLLKEK